MRESGRKSRAPNALDQGRIWQRPSRYGRLEIPLVDREHPPDTFMLGHSDQRRIGQVHRQAAIFPHQLAHARAIVATELDHQLNFGYTQHAPQLVLCWYGGTRQLHWCGQYRPGCVKQISNAGLRFTAVPMMRVAPVNQRDKRAGVDQYTSTTLSKLEFW
jgi:hypothetical protein